LIWPLLLTMTAGCAGYRGGWQSVAYIGDAPPPVATTAGPDSAGGRPMLRLPGLELQVSLDNQLRTADTKVYLFVLPFSVDPRDAYPKNNQPGRTRAFITVTPTEEGFVFRPADVVLQVGDKRTAGMAGYEFGMWDAQGRQVTAGGTWDHRPVGPEFVLANPGRRYFLSVDFDTPVPSPESADIALDLSRGLVSKRYPPVPLIRFAPLRWKEGYT
jgi:hypothetical protein